MFKTYWSWLAIAGSVWSLFFAGRIATIVGVTLLAIYAFKEFSRASGLYCDSWMTGAVYAGIVTVGIASLISDPRGEEPGPGWYGLFVAMPALEIALILSFRFCGIALAANCNGSRSPLSVLFALAGCSVTSDSSPTQATPTALFATLFSRRRLATSRHLFSEKFSVAIRCGAKSARTRHGKARSERSASP